MACQRWSVHSKGDLAKIKFFSARAEAVPTEGFKQAQTTRGIGVG
jgi:hypothetical protein